MTATLLDLENFKKYIEPLHDNIENSTSMLEDDWITLDQYIDISKNDLLKYNQLLTVPLYLFRSSDNYCYVMVHNEVECDLFAYWCRHTATQNWFISSTPPLNKIKIGIRTDPLARFINNFKLLSISFFKLNAVNHPTGFTIIGYHSILNCITNEPQYRPFVPVTDLHVTADIIISEDVFYNSKLLDSSNLELLRCFKRARRSHIDMLVDIKRLDPETFFYATSRNAYIEENVYHRIVQDNTLIQSFDNKYNTMICNYPKTYRKFAKTYFKTVLSNG